MRYNMPAEISIFHLSSSSQPLHCLSKLFLLPKFLQSNTAKATSQQKSQLLCYPSKKELEMASNSAVSMAMPLTSTSHKRLPCSSDTFFKPLPVRQSKAAVTSKSNARLAVQASLKEKAVTGLTAAALTASMVIPEVAEAAGSGLSPSLQNFLVSIAAGGVVLGVIVGAVIGVANFDPVKRT